MVSLFLAWISASATSMGMTISLDVPGFSLAIGSFTVMGITTPIPIQGYAILALVGGIIALIGGIGLLIGKRPLGFLLPVGGILAIAGAGWGLAEVTNAIAEFGMTDGTVSVGYGVYTCIVGGVIALIGSLGLKEK